MSLFTSYTHLTHKPKNTPQGFTIVELLIVIVVIAILAAISIVSYNGIQQRAKNTAIINAASQSLRVIQAYIASTGRYPSGDTNTDSCVTSTTGCRDGSTSYFANSTFDTAMSSIGSLPRSVPALGANAFGIRYNYVASRLFNGSLQPAVLQYWLFGRSAQCELQNVMSGNWFSAISSGTGYYSNAVYDGIEKTQCIISIPGPSV